MSKKLFVFVLGALIATAVAGMCLFLTTHLAHPLNIYFFFYYYNPSIRSIVISTISFYTLIVSFFVILLILHLHFLSHILIAFCLGPAHSVPPSDVGGPGCEANLIVSPSGESWQGANGYYGQQYDVKVDNVGRCDISTAIITFTFPEGGVVSLILFINLFSNLPLPSFSFSFSLFLLLPLLHFCLTLWRNNFGKWATPPQATTSTSTPPSPLEPLPPLDSLLSSDSLQAPPSPNPPSTLAVSDHAWEIR